ncbi:MAG: TonB-dependent receptor [Bacteroidales bacterium]|nr:TonB-dependent receptor [Bacteroidales bacterium]
MFKKLFIAFSLALIAAFAAKAQDPVKLLDPLDGWFAGAGAGLTVGADGLRGGSPDLKAGFPALQLYGGKWISPAFGVRFGINGLHGAGFDGGYGYEFFSLPVDVLVDIPSLLLGWDKQSPLGLSLYASVNTAWGIPSGYGSLGLGGGFLGTWRISGPWGAFVDVRGTLLRQSVTGNLYGGRYALGSVTVGAQYYLDNPGTSKRPAGGVAAGEARASQEAAPAPVWPEFKVAEGYYPGQVLGLKEGWFQGIGLGVTLGADGLRRQLPDIKAGFPGIQIFGGKWLTNTLGARFGINGLHGAALNGKYGYDYVSMPLDLLVDVPVLFFGMEKENPLSLSLYASAIPAIGIPSGNGSFGVGGGFLGSYRISGPLGVYVDLRGTLSDQKMTGDEKGYFAYGSATIGTLYYFNFTEKHPVQAAAAAEEAKASQQAAPAPVVPLSEIAAAGLNEPARGSGVTLGEYTGGIKGTIVNRAAKAAIEGARVHVYSGASELATVVTDNEGNFNINGVPDGAYTLQIEAPDFYANQINLTVNDGYVKNMFKLSLTPSQVIDNAEDASLQEFDMDDSGYNDSPTVLFGSNDVFTSVAGYNWGAIRFKNRGYESQAQDVFLAGVKMNDALTGYGPFSLWSGLNEATRGKESTVGNEMTDYGWSGFNGATNIFGNATSVRNGFRVGALTNTAFYRLRLMASYASGMQDNGWAYAFNVSARLGGNDWIDGVYYRSFAYYGSVEKKFNDVHKLGFGLMGTPGRRGKQNASTQEVYDLIGDNMYNSNWGYQGGKMRNSREARTHEPITWLKYDFTPNDRFQMSATALFRFGHNGATALDWYDAQDPRPDYYRNLPSYYLSDNEDLKRVNEEKAAWTREIWTNPKAYNDYVHVNWDKMYEINAQSVDEDGKIRSKYVQQERRVDQRDFNFAISAQYKVAPWLKLAGGFNTKVNRTEYYTIVADLLGGDYFVNIDNFAERDFASDYGAVQNDLDYYNAHGEAQKVKKGDKYGYDYYAHVRNTEGWLNAKFAEGNLSGNLALKLGRNTFWREGIWKKGLFPDNSQGESEHQSFLTSGVKAGVNYVLNGSHKFYANIGYYRDAPRFTQAFVSPRTRNSVMDGLTVSKTFSTDINYQLFMNGYNLRVTGFYTTIKDQTDLMSVYDDLQNAFTNFALTGIDQRHMGVELGFKAPLPIPNLSVQGALSLGQYIYTSNPRMTQTVDNSDKVIMKDELVPYWMSHPTADGKFKQHYVPGTPQFGSSIGLSWSKNYWFVEADIERFANAYMDMNPLYRTDYACAGPDLTEDPEEVEYMCAQEKFKPFTLVNASVGKSWFIHYKYQLGFNFSVKNLLNATDIRTGGYEQTRLIDNTKYYKRYYRFDSKYFYYCGLNYMLNVYFRF